VNSATTRLSRGSPAAVDAETQSAERLSIVHLCTPAQVGGLESVVTGLSRGLAERGHSVTLVAVVRRAEEAASLFGSLEGGSVNTIAVDVPHRAYLREIGRVAGILDALRPDVLHSHGYRADLLHGARARRKGIATVSTLHGYSNLGGLMRLYPYLQLRAMRQFDAVVAVSLPLVDLVANRGVPRERIHHIRNAWSPPKAPLARSDARRVLDLPDSGTIVIGWVGRLSPVKGADVFLRSLPGLLDASHIACVVGDGPERPALEALAKDLGIRDHLRWAGSVPEASRLFSAFDVLALSSRSEGSPMVLIEAMGQGVPVVATLVGGVPELIDGDDEAWLVPPEAPDMLRDALHACLSDPSQAAARAQRAQARIERELDMTSWVRLHENAYEAARRIRRRGS
jgi:glycosyltransferase involved in cell wall biosynthesis